MYILYASAAVCFRTRLENRGVSRTVIARNLWKWHYVFTFVLDRLTLADGDSKSKRLHIAELDKILGTTTVKGKKSPVRYSKIILDDLVSWGVLKRRWDTSKKRTKVFVKIPDETLQQGYAIWQVNKLAKTCPVKPPIAPLTGIYRQIADNLACVEFNAEAARAYTHQAFANKMPLPAKRRNNIVVHNRYVDVATRSYWLKAIDAMETKEYRAVSDEHKTGRLFSRLSNLPKQLRQFLTIHGKLLVEADIAASQCLIFAILLKRKFGDDLPDDVQRFVRLCETGEFYNTVKPLVLVDGEPDMDMGLFKVTFFARVFFSNEQRPDDSSNKPRTYAWRTRFAAPGAFPTVSACISEFKAPTYKELPRMLSHLESEIMLHRITPRLFAEGITEQFSVHDSFFCTEGDRPRIEAIIREEYHRYGVTPFIKSKSKPDAHLDAVLDKLEASFASLCGEPENILEAYASADSEGFWIEK